MNSLKTRAIVADKQYRQLEAKHFTTEMKNVAFWLAKTCLVE